MAEKSSKQIKVTLIKSINRRIKQHKACVSGLGLRRLGQSVVLNRTPEICGMIKQVNYLLAVEEV